MTDIREQIERLQGIDCKNATDCYLNAGCINGCCLANEAADTMEKLLAVYEAAIRVVQVVIPHKPKGDKAFLALCTAVSAVQGKDDDKYHAEGQELYPELYVEALDGNEPND